MKVHFETFGCRLNKAESLALQAGFEARGWTVAEGRHDADLIVVRGCSVTSRAQKDCEKYIEHVREKFPMKRLVVTGCLRKKRNEFILRDVSLKEIPTSVSRAFLKVQDGCSGGCAYCTVPIFRGAPRSVPFGEVMEMADKYLAAGFGEIVVTGCNLALYSSDGRDLPGLARELAALAAGRGRLRLGSLEPGAALDGVAEAASENENICRHFHIALQSGSDKILRSMGRAYRAADVERTAADIRQAMPFASLGCDVISGLPGETPSDHALTKKLLAAAKFDKAHVFKYSARPGTAAADMACQVGRETKSMRAHDIADAIDRARTEYAKRFKDKIVEIAVEDCAGCAGWTGEHLWFRSAVPPARRPVRRTLVKVLVKKTCGHELRGELVDG